MILRASIEGFENYQVFSTGKIYSLKSGKYLKPSIDKGGYHKVDLWKGKKRYTRRIVRLVAETFIPNPNNKPQVNHKDGIKSNNEVSNLEWVTRSENMIHAVDTGLLSNIPKTAVRVYDYKTGNFKSLHPSVGDASRFYGLNRSSIFKVLRGAYKQINGLIFIKV